MQNFAKIFSRNAKCENAKQIEAKIFAFFASERNAKMKQNGREKFFFRETIFLFAGNPNLKLPFPDRLL